MVKACSTRLMFVAAFLLTLAMSRSASAATYYVDVVNGSSSNGGTSWTDALVSLDAAIAAASSGDIIKIAGGEYVPSLGTARNRTFTIDFNLTISGGFRGGTIDPDTQDQVTTLSGFFGPGATNRSYHIMTIESGTGGAPTVTLTHLQFCGGNADCSSCGGGALLINGCANVSVTSCKFFNNFATTGGSIYYQGTSCGSGHGLFTLSDCEFTRSGATDGHGGAVVAYCREFSADNCRFQSCYAISSDESPDAVVRGGAIFVDADSSAYISSCNSSDCLAGYDLTFSEQTSEQCDSPSNVETLHSNVDGVGGLVYARSIAGDLYLDTLEGLKDGAASGTFVAIESASGTATLTNIQGVNCRVAPAYDAVPPAPVGATVLIDLGDAESTARAVVRRSTIKGPGGDVGERSDVDTLCAIGGTTIVSHCILDGG